ncbi:hypothetical protein GCM10011405_30540 [Rufibacter glacialis]|nr:hypothetical protein GCM10011405_30540 [Rufibacter glacialis]
MSKKSAKERLLQALADGQVEIIDHLYREEVSDVSYNEYFLGDQTSETIDKAKEEYTKLLERLYTEFKDTADEEMVQASNSDLYLRNLKKKLEEVKKLFDSNRQEVQARIEKHRYRVPEEKMAFLNSMADIQSGYIGKTIQYVEEAISDMYPQVSPPTNGVELKLKFNLRKNEVITLFLLLESAGFLKSKVTENEISMFLEKHVTFNKKDESESIKGLSSLLAQIKNERAVKPYTIKKLKDRIAKASIVTNDR